ncbi:MAG: prolipoprotein diacylglyceryl transferase [Bacteroidales bacterium]|nr:prolipoprotein diacylglyceryl transferase [Bacteroidales bacterium]
MLAYITWNADPILIRLGNLRIGWYGLLLACGFLLAYLVFQKMVTREGLPEKTSDRFAVSLILWTVVGLRIGHCLFYDWAYFSHHLLEIFIPFVETAEGWKFTGYAGLASHGGAIAIFCYVLWFSHKRRVRLLWLLDRLAIAIPIAAAFVRCGNLMNSEIIGTVTSKPWGFIFMQLQGTDECCEPRHPAQLYEAFVYLCLFLFQVWYYFKHTKGKIYAGRAVGISLSVIFIARFIIEFFKKEQVDFEKAMTLDMGQWLSIPFILLGLAFLIWSYRKKTLPTPLKEGGKNA